MALKNYKITTNRNSVKLLSFYNYQNFKLATQPIVYRKIFFFLHYLKYSLFKILMKNLNILKNEEKETKE